MNITCERYKNILVAFALLAACCVAASTPLVLPHLYGSETTYFYRFMHFWPFVFIEAESAPFAACAFLFFVVAGISWHRASGTKKIFCYLVFLYFALMVGYGSMSFEFYLTWRTFGDTPLEEPSKILYWQYLGAGVLALCLVEGISRLLYPPEK